MPVRIPHHTVVIHRDGKNIRPPIGKPFNFTSDEIEEITGLHPRALRRPVHEHVAAPVEEVTSETEEGNGSEADDNPAPVRAATRKAPRKSAVIPDDDEL